MTRLERWSAGTSQGRLSIPGGLEIFVLEGALEDAGERFEAGAWLRIPHGAGLDGHSAEGCVLYVKAGGVASLRSASEPL